MTESQLIVVEAEGTFRALDVALPCEFGGQRSGKAVAGPSVPGKPKFVAMVVRCRGGFR